MPLISSISAGARAFGLYVLTALVSVIDTFNRANNSTDLGSVSGQKWKIWRGAWEILTNKAYSASTPSTNALATLTFTKTDVTVSISGQDAGMGVSFWVTDANNWYASVYTQTEVCQTCYNCSGNYNPSTCNAWNASTCNANCCNGFFPTWSPYCSGSYNACTQWSACTSWNACTAYSACTSWNACTAWSCSTYNSANTGNKAPPYGFCFAPTRVCNGGQTCSSVRNCISGQNCSSVRNCTAGQNCINSTGNCTLTGTFCCGTFNTSNCSGNYNASFCNAFSAFSCNCTTEHRVNLIQSIAGTVSTISANLFSAAIASFKTLLSGNSATITAYSSVNYVTQIGNSVATNISPVPVKTTSHGIIKSSSPFSQGTSIDDFGVS